MVFDESSDQKVSIDVVEAVGMWYLHVGSMSQTNHVDIGSRWSVRERKCEFTKKSLAQASIVSYVVINSTCPMYLVRWIIVSVYLWPMATLAIGSVSNPVQSVSHVFLVFLAGFCSFLVENRWFEQVVWRIEARSCFGVNGSSIRCGWGSADRVSAQKEGTCHRQHSSMKRHACTVRILRQMTH